MPSVLPLRSTRFRALAAEHYGIPGKPRAWNCALLPN